MAVYYLEKIRDLLGWIMLYNAHSEPKNQVGENFLEEHVDKLRLKAERPLTGWLVWWWRQ